MHKDEMHDLNCAPTLIDEGVVRFEQAWTVLTCRAGLAFPDPKRTRIGRLNGENGSAIWLVFRLPPITLRHTSVQPFSA